jgi:hypothetical protein
MLYFYKKTGGFMKMDYICPSSAQHEGETGMLILMNPEIGNYHTIHHPSHAIEDGSKFDFFCPVCHHKLSSQLNENLVMVQVIDQNDKMFELHFSRIAGQKCTYTIMGKSVETFGIDAPHYLDFMNLVDWS